MRVNRDQEAARRFAQAKQLRLARWHEEWLGEMLEHARRSPWATAWLLEHNFPECYLNRPFVRDSGSLEQQPVCSNISLEQLVANATLAAQIAANPPLGLLPKEPALPAAEAQES